MKTTYLSKDKIILFNSQFVYFLKGKSVYRARRSVSSVGGTTTRESSRGQFIIKSTICRVKTISNTCNRVTVETLIKFGVEVT